MVNPLQAHRKRTSVMKVYQATKSFLDYPRMNSKKNSQEQPVPSHRGFQPIWLPLSVVLER